jgi:uncharacterized protein
VSLKLLRTILLLLACLVLATGCSSTRRDAENRLLSRHAIGDTRMSNHPMDGYVPTGVWRIRGVQNTVYLVGTSHIVTEDQLPLPSPFYAAYEDSKIVYIEFDTNLSFFEKMRLMPKMMKWMKVRTNVILAPKGKTLADYLSRDTLEEIRARYGKDYSKEPYKPTFLLFMKEAEMFDDKGEKPSGVETPFQILAHRDGKPLRELDSEDVMDTALLMLDEMIAGYQRDIARRGADAVVKEALLGDSHEENETWRHGDMAGVLKLHEEMKNDSPAIYEKALPERNRKWMRELEPLLQKKQNAMVLVGVGHVGGEEGLLNLLRKAGFSAEQMYGVDRPALPARAVR